jgi:AcrR family transcriptional regulator
VGTDGGSEETLRGQVLDAAGALFYARGIQDVGMDDIRAATGLSLKRLYQLFGSKNELVAGYLAMRDRRFRAGLARFVDATDDPREKLLAVFDWLASWFSEDDFRGCAFVNSFGELGATNETVAEAARLHKRAVRDRLAELSAAAGGSTALAEHLELLAEGATNVAAISGSPDAAQQAKQAAAVLVDAALGPAGGDRRGSARR